MRKNLYLSIVGAIALAMTVVSCNSKSNEPTIEPLGNSGLSVITTPRGELGLKKGEETIITPSVDNKSFAVFDSFVLAKYDDGSQAVQRLLDPETGIEVVSGDSIINAGSYFIGTHSNGMSTIYVPASKFRFAGQQFAVSGSDAVSVFNGKITVYVDGKEAIPATSDYQKIMRMNSKTLFNHSATKHNALALRRLAMIPKGAGKEVLPPEERTKSIYSGTWSRMIEDDISVTITTRYDTPSSGRFTHPILDRCITTREAARIQSFPDTFRFYGTKTCQMKQVGNAVPPLLAKAIAEQIKKNEL